MKREHLLIAAMALMTVSSCTKEESTIGATSQSQNSVDVINLVANTTRAETMELSDLMGDTDGFEVYATSTDGNNVKWLINSDSYIYGTSDWGWKSSDHKWPTDKAMYPVTFYSVYATDLSNVVKKTATDITTDTPLTAVITIAPPQTQVDLLASMTSTATKPADGKLAITFDHVLTKVDFGIIPGSGKEVYLATFALNELENTGEYDIKNSNWSVTSSNAGAGYPITDFSALTGVVGDETTATSLTNTAAEDSFMLLPQTTTTWAVDSWNGVIDNITDTHIDMIYRATNGTGADTEDYIGYTVAQDHPDYDENNAEHTAYENEPLFVRVGYPLTSTWVAKKNFVYNIKIGTEDATNGHLLDDVYYDKDGNVTPFPIDFDKEVGEELSDGNIHFDVTVSGWDSEVNTTTID